MAIRMPSGKRVYGTGIPPVEAEGLSLAGADLDVALTERLPPILSDSAGTRQIQDLLGGVATRTSVASACHELSMGSLAAAFIKGAAKGGDDHRERRS